MGLHEVGGEAAAMPFKKFAQIGRVVYLNEGPYRGKLAVIVDIIDTNSALIDGPCHGVPRQEYKFCTMQLTRYMLSITRGQRSKLISAAWKAAQVTKKFEKSDWAKNIKKGVLRRKRTDFERFQLGRAKQTRNKMIKAAYFHVKATKSWEKKAKLDKKPCPKKVVVTATKKAFLEKRSAKLAARKQDPKTIKRVNQILKAKALKPSKKPQKPKAKPEKK